MSYVKATAFLIAYFVVGTALMAALYGPIFIFGLWWLPVPLTFMFGGLVYFIAENFQ